LTYVPDGLEAYARVEAEPYDLIIIDMKMPPEEWGGLWLLKELRDRGWRFPAIVLSGEGTKRQTIEALRNGAVDWIDKSSGGEELEERVSALLRETIDAGLETASANLPTPLAQRLDAYSRRVGTEWQAIEGLRALEAILRLTAILGLSTAAPFALGDVSRQIMRPSMGTWLSLCRALDEASDAGSAFSHLHSSLVPDRKHGSLVQDQVRIRNAIAHGGYSPSLEEAALLHDLLTQFAHRANTSWRSTLAVPVSMAYDGAEFAISIMSFSGSGLPRSTIIMSPSQVRTGSPILIESDSQLRSLRPWMIVSSADASEMQCEFFDGVRQRGSKLGDTDDPLVYMNPATGEHGIVAKEADLTWSAIGDWMSNASAT
jgi:CheY-like chemotaxis protein